MELKGIFTSVWDGGVEITTPAELLESGEVFIQSVDVDDMDLDILDDEFFTDVNGKTYPICPTCHTFITKTVRNAGDQLVTGCTDPTCENYYENY
jgi:hypothetical protein